LCCTLVPICPASNPVLVHRPTSSPPAPQGSLASCTFAFGYTSALPTCDWTCSLIRTPFPVTLDAKLEIGTLAERTSKQPGSPGTQRRRVMPEE
jgi:hypothetical protein